MTGFHRGQQSAAGMRYGIARHGLVAGGKVALLALATVLALATGLALSPTVIAAEPDAAQRAAIEAVVRELLQREPELVLNALQAIEDKQEKAEAEARAKETGTVVKAVFQSDAVLRTGKMTTDGAVPVVEFVDYNCGYCKAMHPRVVTVLDGAKDVAAAFVQFPILSESSGYAARAVIALQRQDRKKAHALHEALLEVRGSLSASVVLDLARKAGADMKQLEIEMRDGRTDEALRQSRDWGDKLQVRGTPAFIVGNRFVGGAVAAETLKSLIEEARKGG